MEKLIWQHIVTLSLLASILLVAAEELAVTVHSSVTITRGGSGTLDGTYSLHLHNDSVECTIVSLSSASACGTVEPFRLHCAEAAPTYTHYGCLAQYETLNFQAYSRTADGRVMSKTFSISVHIATNWPSIQLAKTLTSKDKSQIDLELVLNFSHNFTSGCYYSIATDGAQLPLPAGGGRVILPEPHRLMPCGHSVPFRYTSSTPGLADALLARTVFAGGPVNYHVLPLTSVAFTHHLPRAFLQVHELSETLLPTDLLPVANLLRDYAHLEFTFPVLATGGFYSLSTAGNRHLDATTFAWAELRRDAVTFRPREGACRLMPVVTLFHYLVSDVAGQTLAEGSVEVTITPRTGHLPSLRKNVPLVVEHGDSSELDYRFLDFYPPQGCSDFSVTVTRPPTLGDFVLDDGTVLAEGSNFSTNYNNFTLEYVHNDNTPRLLDHSVWTIHCQQQLPFSVVLRQIVVPPVPSERHLVNISRAAVTNHASPLDLPLARQCDFASSTLITISSPDGQVLQWKDNCVPPPSSPYVKSDVLPSCLVHVSNLSRVNPAHLWHMPYGGPGNSTHLSLVSEKCAVSIQLSIAARAPSLTSKSGNISGEDPSLPYLQIHRPLPIATSQPVHVSRDFLYVHSMGHLQEEIKYSITSRPRYGHLCTLYHLDCSRSLSSFTQTDLLGNKVYYKPLNYSTDPRNDSFNFHISYFNNTRLPGSHTFEIRAVKEEKLEPRKQYWVAQGRTKPLALKHLQHFMENLKSKQTIFTILVWPQYGFLELPEGRNDSFTWKDTKNRSVKYHHSGARGCSDALHLMATDGRHTVYGNLSLAIRLDSEVGLDLLSREHTIGRWNNSFVLSPGDLTVRSGFCSEFVQLSVNSTPSYGVLMERDPALGTTRHLTPESTFSVATLEKGLISYFLKLDLALMNDAHDSFVIFVEDPDIDRHSLKRDAEATSVRVRIFVISVGADYYFLNFTFASPKYIGVLESGGCGTIFGPADIHLQDSDIQPVEVDLSITTTPTHGVIQKDGHAVSEFTLDQLHNGEISYISTLSHIDTNITTDQFEFELHIIIEGTKSIYNEVFHLEWCYFTISSTHQFVDEGATAHFVIR